MTDVEQVRLVIDDVAEALRDLRKGKRTVTKQRIKDWTEVLTVHGINGKPHINKHILGVIKELDSYGRQPDTIPERAMYDWLQSLERAEEFLRNEPGN